MKQSSVTLFLCSSLLCAPGHGSAQDGASQRLPWADRAPAAGPTAPLEMKSSGSIADFGFGTARGTAAPWMNESFERLKKASPIGEGSAQAEMEYDMQVFISAGMPDGVLRHMFQQAMAYPAGKVRFVVRGFTPQQLGPLVSKLRGLFPDPYTDHIALEVDPNAFRTYKVEAVPVFLVREGPKWFEVQGSQSLEAAQANVKKRSKSVVGELYAIAEPDILAIMEERAKKFDWKPVLARAQARIGKNLKPGFDLPTASRDATSYVVPTFTVPHDITAPSQDGKSEVVLGRAGQQVNLLQHTRLQVPIIVFDPSDKRQVTLVKRWLTRPEMRNADLFVVGDGLEPSNERTPVFNDIARAFKRPVYPWLAKLGDRMGVEAVPSIVEQEGERLRVRTFDPEKR